MVTDRLCSRAALGFRIVWGYCFGMIRHLLDRLSAPAEQAPDGADGALALAALLVRLARADGEYTQDEADRIETVLSARHGLAPSDATDLRRRAEEIEEQAPDTVRFTRAIKDAVPHEQRIGIVEELWSVALADGERDPDEDALVRMAVRFLGVSDRDSALARQRVERMAG